MVYVRDFIPLTELPENIIASYSISDRWQHLGRVHFPDRRAAPIFKELIRTWPPATLVLEA